MTENVLQYLWQNALINFNELYTREGQKVTILHKGIWNHNAGPDFLDAKIQIEHTIWVGHIEFHLKTSQWFAHKHDYDDKYKNVILHIVLEDDAPELLQHIPHIVIKDKYDKSFLKQYEHFIAQPQVVICSNFISQVPSIIITNLKERALIERWHDKYSKYTLNINQQNFDWKTFYYKTLAIAFGFKINQDGFDRLTNSTPFQILEKHKNSLFQLEALLFGQANLIPAIHQDEYTAQLESEYHFLRRKYNLTPINGSIWNFSRLRPANFPTIRIAQFAHFLYQSQMQFDVIAIQQPQEIINYFTKLNISTSKYFDTHYRLSDQSLQSLKKNIGKRSIEHIIINAIAPLRYWYHSTFKANTSSPIEDAIAVLVELHAEQNNITNLWPEKCKNAFDSQAIIQTINTKCKQKQCLKCPIGNFILKKY